MSNFPAAYDLCNHCEETKDEECASCRFSTEFAHNVSVEQQLTYDTVDLNNLSKSSLVALVLVHAFVFFPFPG